MSDENSKFIFKIITMGCANSGKTMLCNRICKGYEENGYNPTIGIEFFSKETSYQDKNILLQLWDTAGQECFAPIVKNYYKNIVGVFFVIDLTSDYSVKKINFWLNEFERNRNPNCETIIIAIGNKIDCKERVISFKDISEIFKKKNIEYREISAKNNENIEETVDFFLEKCFNEINIESHPGIHFRNRERKIVFNDKRRDSCSYAEVNCCSIS